MRKRIRPTCLAVALILSTSLPASAVNVEQLDDLTAGVMPVVAFKKHDTFTNEYIYAVSVINRTGDPVLAGTLVLVVSEVLDLSGKDVLAGLEVLNPDGNAGGKPYFVIPIGELPELLPYKESLPVTVSLRSPDYVSYYPPSFQVMGIRRTAAQSLEKLIEQLQSKGVLSEEEARKALRP
jgi:hypothetical protein